MEEFKGELVLRHANDRLETLYDTDSLLHAMLDVLERKKAKLEKPKWVLQMRIFREETDA